MQGGGGGGGGGNLHTAFSGVLNTSIDITQAMASGLAQLDRHFVPGAPTATGPTLKVRADMLSV
jgi:hypothetical protein